MGLINHHSSIEGQHPRQPGARQPGSTVGAEQQARRPHRRRHTQHSARLRGAEPGPIRGRRATHRGGDQRCAVLGLAHTQPHQSVAYATEDRVIRGRLLQEATNPCRARGMRVGERPAVDHHGQSSGDTLRGANREQSHSEDVYLHN